MQPSTKVSTSSWGVRSVITEQVLRPRLLNLEQVRESCGGIGRDLALEVMGACGKIYIGRRVFITPTSLDEYIARRKEEGPPT